MITYTLFAAFWMPGILYPIHYSGRFADRASCEAVLAPIRAAWENHPEVIEFTSACFVNTW